MVHDFDWQRVHQELSRLAKSRSHLDWEEGTWLVRGFRSGVHHHLGYGSFAEYVERLFGYSPRWTEERMRVAESLEKLPELEQALRDGEITWSTARELTCVAVSGNEGQWLQATKGRTARQVEEMVAGHRPGDGPSDRADPSLRRHVLRMEVSAETFATFREAMAKLRRDAGEALDDDAAMLLMSRNTLGGPNDEGRANYQVALTVCEACGHGWQQGRADQVEVGPEVVEMASCDAQHVGHIDSPASTHVGVSRAHQDIPPAVRRKVMRRDGGRCVVPGCRHATFVDIHHIVLRSEGGDHDEDALIVLCSAHHRAQHRGQLIVEGRVSTGLGFQHADGTSYGSAVNPQTAEAHAQAFRALRHLGFREGETRAALERVRTSGQVGDTRTEDVIRAALGVLASARQRRIVGSSRQDAHA
jgi:RuvA, C-terminal domain